MRIDVVSIFPDYLAPARALARRQGARQRGLLDVHVHDLREWTHDRHRTVDDTPYGGGAGMVMKPEPWGEALDACPARAVPPSWCRGPSGEPFSQALARDLAGREHLVFVCGRYEGIDQRVVEDAAGEPRCARSRSATTCSTAARWRRWWSWRPWRGCCPGFMGNPRLARRGVARGGAAGVPRLHQARLPGGATTYRRSCCPATTPQSPRGGTSRRPCARPSAVPTWPTPSQAVTVADPSRRSCSRSSWLISVSTLATSARLLPAGPHEPPPTCWAPKNTVAGRPHRLFFFTVLPLRVSAGWSATVSCQLLEDGTAWELRPADGRAGPPGAGDRPVSAISTPRPPAPPSVTTYAVRTGADNASQPADVPEGGLPPRGGARTRASLRLTRRRVGGLVSPAPDFRLAPAGLWQTCGSARRPNKDRPEDNSPVGVLLPVPATGGTWCRRPPSRAHHCTRHPIPRLTCGTCEERP